jgi:DNA helicase HerA-like ATPase
LIDKDGKLHEIQLVTEFIGQFVKEGLSLELPDGTYPYTLEHLKEAFDFALISEGILNSDKVYDYANILKVRLNSLLSSNYRKYFEYDEFVTKDQYLKKLLTSVDGGNAQIVNFNINYIDDRMAKVITKIYAKMLYDYVASLEERASFPIHLVLEEAHRYVQNDDDIFLLGYNIFDRITKEGRKYGIILGLISQRPSELSETALSQCSNFLIFKMVHPQDTTYIRNMVPNITNEIVEKLKTLQPGTCVAFGNAFKIPTIIHFDFPDPAPESHNADISTQWF